MQKELEVPGQKALAAASNLPMAIDAEKLIMSAIEKNLPVETMEKLLAMRRELQKEYAERLYNEALAAFQAECPVIQKNKKVMNKDGRSVRYCYAPMDDIISQVRGLLTKHGFSYDIGQKIDNSKEKTDWLVVYCTATHRAGHSKTKEFPIPVAKSGYMTDQQEIAAARTFAARYCFNGVFGIMTGDEDNDAQNTKTKEEKKDPTATTTGASAPASSSPASEQKKPEKPSEKPIVNKTMGLITDVVKNPKPSSNKSHRWKIVVDGKENFYTFNTKFTDLASKECANGPVTITWEQGKFGRDIVSLTFAHLGAEEDSFKKDFCGDENKDK